MLEKIGKIEKVAEKIQLDRPLQWVDQGQMRDKFDKLMQRDVNTLEKLAQTDPLAAQKLKSPIDEANAANSRVKLHPEDTTKITSLEDAKVNIAVQTRDAAQRIENLRTKLGGADVELKPSVEGLMQQRLVHIDSGIKSSLSKLGVEQQSADKAGAAASAAETVGEGALKRFLGFLTYSQGQLDSLSGIVGALNTTQSNITPGAMIAIQVKMARVQQEIELFTALLNKALESTKTIMNVQV
jgi:hypothetical protein